MNPQRNPSYMRYVVLLAVVNCGGVTFTEPFGREAKDAAPEAQEYSRLYVDMGDLRALPPGPKPQPSICPVPGQACSLPSPFEETCVNGESYWMCVDGGWTDKWCGAFPAAICKDAHCIGPNYCP